MIKVFADGQMLFIVLKDIDTYIWMKSLDKKRIKGVLFLL